MNSDKSKLYRRLLALLFIVALAFTIRALTANFIRAHFDDPSWFQFGSYAVFDGSAQAILDRKEPIFWINDPARTDRIVYPPGYSWWLAFIYKLSGNRSPASVQRVQATLDSIAVLLIVAIGAIAYSWTVGMLAGTFAALSPLLALAGATPNADAPTSWLVLGATCFLLLATRKKKVAYAVAAGALLGMACWLRVNPLLLFIVWSIGLLLFFRERRRKGILFAAALSLATLLVIAPVVIRNVIIFYPEIAPTGLGVGWNLLAGIGETERGAEFGAPCCDAQMIEQDRQAMNLPADAQLGLFFPDGIRRDRERGRKALSVITAHPVWYAGVMARRIAGHFKFFGKPAGNVGSAGFNVTSKKCLSAELQTGVPAFGVNALGMIQSVLRFVALPLMLVGIVIAWRSDWRGTALILTVVVYYVVTLAIGHSEIRYGLPMQALLFIFAAVTVSATGAFLARQWRQKNQPEK
jgi:4-amino-4-deoxy-L-arabinose transferase-like glycosyltransferase